ncbi:MAG: hypothetical protein K2K00_02825, partial [Muribaculaceae bacterium]|nr:hypothetical protein [Muribaculaceae bacterium]
ENVTIKGRGTFTRTSEAEQSIVFTIDPELAAAVNQPFEMFEPIAVGDADISEPMIADVPENTSETPIETSVNQSKESIIKTDTVVDEKQETATTPTPPDSQIETQSTQYYEEYKGIPLEMEVSSPRNHTLTWSILAFLTGLILGAVMAYFGYDSLCNLFGNNENYNEYLKPEPCVTSAVESVETLVVEEVIEDTVPESKAETEPTAPKELPWIKAEAQVFDTVTPNRFLTTMARQYYNQMEYWVFIYEANSDKLGNPNKIKPGTRVIIPARSDFEPEGSREQTLARAKSLASDIYNRFE